MKIIFAGTSLFAIPALHILQKDHDILAVITAPDAPRGRGKKVRPSPVKEAAREYGLAVHDAPIHALSYAMRALHPDLMIVASYGAMVPGDVLAIPCFGALNIHPSLLPKYRGASPIQATILNGDTETGITIIRMTGALDAGPVVAQKKIALSPEITAGELHNALAAMGAKLLQETLEKGPPFAGVPQNESRATHTKKITPLDAELNPRESAVVLERKVRAYNPAPGTHVITQNTKYKIQNDNSKFKIVRLKIFRAYVKKNKSIAQYNPSHPLVILENLPAIVCGDGNALVLTEVQPEGRNRMTGEEFVNGYLSARP